MSRKPLTDIQIFYTQILLECIAAGQYKIYYSDLSDRYNAAHRNKTHVKKVGDDIGEISKHCYDIGLPPISVMVVNREFEVPSEGFWNLCKELMLYPVEILNSWKKCNKQAAEDVRNCKEWWKLAEYIGAEIEGISKPADIPDVENNSDNTAPAAEAENEPSPLPEPTAGTEGRRVEVTLTAYERDPSLRRKCLEHYGAVCQICGFDAAEKYGEEFGGLIHVHHIVPLSMVKDEHEVDPIKDLIPVCPNCHMMIHSKKDGVYTPDELRDMMNRKK